MGKAILAKRLAEAHQGLTQKQAADILDTLLDDTRTEDVARRLPAGYLQHIGAPTLLLLPLVRQGRCVGLLYADRARARELVLSEDELALVRALKNQALLALKLGAR